YEMSCTSFRRRNLSRAESSGRDDDSYGKGDIMEEKLFVYKLEEVPVGYRYVVEAVHKRFGHTYEWRFSSFDDLLAMLPTIQNDYHAIQVFRLDEIRTF